jgi:hypothetical protein
MKSDEEKKKEQFNKKDLELNKLNNKEELLKKKLNKKQQQL